MKHLFNVFTLILLLAAIEAPLPAVGVVPPGNDVAAPAPHLVVFYFHGTSRCRTCRAIEKYTRAAVQSGFEEELAAGKMELRAVNIDLKENRHFIKDYQLFTRSVVISMRKENKEVGWKRLDRVWELVGDEAAFTSYIQDEIRAIAREKSK